MTQLQQAQEIAKRYDFKLPKKYKGHKLVWHPWHQPADHLLYPMTFDEYINRIVTIGTIKPENERKERFTLMKIALYQQPIKHAAWQKADAARQKADAARQKADAARILAAHARECPNCKWDGNKLPQFD